MVPGDALLSVRLFADWQLFGVFPVPPYSLPVHVLDEVRWLSANVTIRSAT